MASRPLLLVLGLFVCGANAACYEATPHRVVVTSHVRDTNCAAAVAKVFARSGFIQLPTPPRLSMFFGARVSGPYSSLLKSGAGIGVTFENDDARAGCRVALEALSPDVSCPGAEMGPDGFPGCRRQGMLPEPPFSSTERPCPTTPATACELTPARSPDNDAAVDEIARRLQHADDVTIGVTSRL
jgi:hypothetical protein